MRKDESQRAKIGDNVRLCLCIIYAFESLVLLYIFYPLRLKTCEYGPNKKRKFD